MHVLPGQCRLQLAKKHTERKSSYPHYSTVLNFTGNVSNSIGISQAVILVQFPMTLSQIKRFINLNISINVYFKEEQTEILSLWLTDQKRGKHVNLLYVRRIHAI